jgi:hypothetical protein
VFGKGGGALVELGTRSLNALLRKQGMGEEALGLVCELLLVMAAGNKKFGLSMRLEGGVDVLCGLVLAPTPPPTPPTLTFLWCASRALGS